MVKIPKIPILIILLTLLFSFTKKANASEGIFELKSITDQPTRCFATSFLFENRKYKIILGCRDLIYPPEADLFTYVLWASPIEGGKDLRLGTLGFGKGLYETTRAFNKLFVTIEQKKQITKPSNNIVMRGNLEKIDFLENSPTPTPTPKVTELEKEIDKESKEKIPEQKPLTTRQKLVIGLKRAGIVAFLALIVLTGLIFVVTRARK